MGKVLPEVKKHVATIHCANTLTLLQRKISNALLFYAYPYLNKQEEYSITIKQLCQLIDYHGNNHAVIKKALKGLLSTVIEWDIIDDSTKEEDWTASTLLASVRIKGAQCLYAYSPRMRELLYLPTMYGKINLAIQAKFNSSYGLALYENCIRYRGLSYTKWFNLPLFRKLMGVEEGTYEIFRDFKRRILDKAVAEVNEYSELAVEPEIERAGHKVVAIRFKLSPKPSNLVFPDEILVLKKEINSSTLSSLAQILVKQFHLTVEKATKWINTYGEEYIQEKIQVIMQSKSHANKKITNPAGYLLKALTENYQPALNTLKFKVPVETSKPIVKNQPETLTHLQQLYAKYRETMIDQALAAVAPDVLESWAQQFEEYLIIHYGNDSHVFQHYKKQGINHKTVKTFFRYFVTHTHSALLPSLLSFEEFQQQTFALTEQS